ncbi:putative anucleate primary sterigmata protein A [Blumeria hordei DH14]|uniref:Putative anucleate primary sterigmata protein A n=1 Tax=Blumeria graminis f. sp. hordei (strain DH14) TaxID=546991 RepID=N1JCE9_BLUG1|nr:putative anucleate primary sterigmata protein A [Blumeria hordei DH14]
MATLLAMDHPQESPESKQEISEHDPFLSQPAYSTHHRFSCFDHESFALSPSTTPDQVKRALEAHLAETERRIQEASTLGKALIQQRKDIAERLEDVQRQQAQEEISPELRQKLAEIEKEYNEVGRDSARAFLPKSRVLSTELNGSPIKEIKVILGYYDSTNISNFGQRSGSPSKERLEFQGVGSPSRLGVVNRRLRNLPSNRHDDLQFATDISTSLLSQLRDLQAILLEKEEQLKVTTLEKLRLEEEAESFAEHLRSLSESGERYKDENWTLETQIHEFISKEKEAADRERRLAQSLNIHQAEKTAAQKELDEIKSIHAKISEDYTSTLKHHEAELGSMRRQLSSVETERAALRRKVDELLGQNHELVKAIASNRGRYEERDQSRGMGDDDLEIAPNDLTPEHSPPPSPVKGTPRHSMLESETLKSSLHHAHRTIQTLKSNIQREKSEKLELRRVLQDARDELEVRRRDAGSGNVKKARKREVKEVKRPLNPGHLGLSRSSKSEIFINDANWEDDCEKLDSDHHAVLTVQNLPVRAINSDFTSANRNAGSPHESSDQFDTANEQENSDAFETAEETQSGRDDVRTVEEEFSEELTETEYGSGGITRSKACRSILSSPGNRHSFHSTASTSDDEYNWSQETRTLNSKQPSRLRLRVGHGSSRRSRVASQEPQSRGSPASRATSSRTGTPKATGQSLFAEIGDMGNSEDEESLQETPTPSRHVSISAAPDSMFTTEKCINILPLPPTPKPHMVESGTMTEPWVPEARKDQIDSQSSLATVTLSEKPEKSGNLEADSDRTTTHMKGPSSQWCAENFSNPGDIVTRHVLTTKCSDIDSQNGLIQRCSGEEMNTLYLAQSSDYSATMTSEAKNIPLSISTIISNDFEPLEIEDQIENWHKKSEILAPSSMVLSRIQSVETEPLEDNRAQKDDTIYSPGTFVKIEDSHDSKPSISQICDFGSDLDKNLELSLPSIPEGRPSSNNQFTNCEKPQKHSDEPSTNKLCLQGPMKQMNVDEGSQTMLTASQISEILREEIEKSKPDKSLKTMSITQASSIYDKPSDKSSNNMGSIASHKTGLAVTKDVRLKIPTSRSHNSEIQDDSRISNHQPVTDGKKQFNISNNQRINLQKSNTHQKIDPATSLLTPTHKFDSLHRPITPKAKQLNPFSFEDCTTPRPINISTGVEVQEFNHKMKSTNPSISSFASEVESRFQMQRGLDNAYDIHSGTDPRMINAITQTMIGEYLWKYTRKTGRGVMSEKRHRRYFWVHPYTKTLYWSDRDPSSAGRAELRAKSVPIEAVRVVTDDNPMPPGLHRKSLIIITPSRAIKFTATTGQRHETWFNSLSYLLLRTGEATSQGTPGIIVHEEVSEFNPEPTNHQRIGMASLSSYNSRTTKNESLENPPHATGLRSYPPTAGTFSRLSGYLKPSKDGVVGSLSSRQSRYSSENNESIYEASQVHDSAEDVREIIEKQDRESDKLENVRACCDGMFDQLTL